MLMYVTRAFAWRLYDMSDLGLVAAALIETVVPVSCRPAYM